MSGLRRGWFHLASGAGSGRILGFLSNMLISRWLGPTNLGLFNLVTTTVQTCDTLVRCGGDYAINYELGADSQRIYTQEGVKTATALTQICSISTALICVLVAIWVSFGRGLFPPDLHSHHRLIYTILLFLMMVSEGGCASAWELLLISHRTAPLALRQGLFYPSRLLFAAIGAFTFGLSGAMCGWIVVSLFQVIWLKNLLRNLWSPFKIFPLYLIKITSLLRRGLPFYGSNLLTSIVFYPLLVQVATDSGLAQIGYLRVGQILQQLFAFLPATLVPLLFLKLRGKPSFEDQAILIETPFRIIWLILLETLLLYCIFEKNLVYSLFGQDFISASLPTRLLLLTALFESLSQLIVQPLLATGQTRIYALWQNGSAVISAFLGWLWIPIYGFSGYLIVKALFVLIPLLGFAIPVAKNFRQSQKSLPLTIVSLLLVLVTLAQLTTDFTSNWITPVLIICLCSIPLFYRDDLLLLKNFLRRVPN